MFLLKQKYAGSVGLRDRITVMSRVEIFEEDNVCVLTRFTFMSI